MHDMACVKQSPSTMKLISISSLLLSLISLLQAETICVDANTAALIPDGTTWAKAYPDLQSALATATFDDQIWVAQGRYYPDEGTGQTDNHGASTFVLIEGVKLYGGFPTGGGDGTFGARDYSSFVTLLSGDLRQNGNYEEQSGDNTNVLTGNDLTSATVLDGLTISDGVSEKGAGLYLTSSSPIINNCSFTHNRALTAGGGIYNDSSSPTFNNCKIDSNSLHDFNLSDGNGGGIYNDHSSPTFNSCSFIGNSAAHGGAMYNDHSSPSLIGCQFHHNGNDIGLGAISNRSSSPLLTNCIFSQNDRGMDNDSSSPILTNCTFDNDGITNINSSSPALVNCIVWGASSGYPGIIQNHSSSIPTYSHCLIGGWSDGGSNDLGGGNNLDGTNPINDPLFSHQATHYPRISNLRLLPGSPAIDTGDSSANSFNSDLDQNPRKVGTIDLGAYESNYSTFAATFPDLEISADENNNGFSNFHDYASGVDPTGPFDPKTTPILKTVEITPNYHAYHVTFSQRINAADITVQYQESSTLAPDSWEPMINGTDYSFNNVSVNGYHSTVTLLLRRSVREKNQIFFRQVFLMNP